MLREPHSGGTSMPVSPRHDTRFVTAALLASAAGVLIVTAGCTRGNSAAAPPAPLEVQVAPVQQKDVPVYREWIGTLDGLVNADIKAQVAGCLVQQAYTEGSFVKQGQLLFQIDPRPFKAVVDQARGQVAQTQGQLEQARAQFSQAEAQVAVAEANQHRVQLDVDRYAPLCDAGRKPAGYSRLDCSIADRFTTTPSKRRPHRWPLLRPQAPRSW